MKKRNQAFGKSWRIAAWDLEILVRMVAVGLSGCLDRNLAEKMREVADAFFRFAAPSDLRILAAGRSGSIPEILRSEFTLVIVRPMG